MWGAGSYVRDMTALLHYFYGSGNGVVYKMPEKGKEKPYEEVLAEMNERDSNDSQRAIAPLVPADDAVIFNNTEYSLEESVAFILDIVRSKSEVNG